MILLYAVGGALFGVAVFPAIGLYRNFFFKSHPAFASTAFHTSMFLSAVVFLYGFYYLNERVLAGQGIFALSSLTASVVLFLLCCGLAAIFYRFNSRRDVSSLLWSYGSMASLAIVMLVGMTYHLLGWGAAPHGFWRVTGVLLGFVMMPLFGFLIEYRFLKSLSSNLQTSSAGALMRIAVLLIAGFGGLSLLGPPSLNGLDANNGEPSAAEMKNLRGKSNVIWIVLDTARLDRLSVYGYERKTTPNLEVFAKDAVVFNRAISAAPWTVPSHASMFTGMYPSKHGAHHSGNKYCDPLSGANLTIAEILSAVGYNTVGIAANNAGLSIGFGLHQGFEMYFEAMPAARSLLWGKLIESLPDDFRNNTLRHNELRLSSELNQMVDRWLDEHGGNPFFLFINYMEPHGGYGYIPQPYDTLFGFRRELHDQLFAEFDPVKVVKKEVAVTAEQHRFFDAYTDRKLVYLDHHLGKFFDDLKARQLYDEAMIIVVSDHGNLDGEHYSFGHNTELYNILINVPLLIKYPKLMQRTGVVDNYVSTIDLMPEVLRVCGFPIPEEVQGQPLDEANHEILAELFEQKNNAHAKLYPERYYRDLKAIYSNDTENLKYIQSSNGNSELYDLNVDPEELNNIIAQRPDTAAALDARIEKWLSSFEPVRDDEKTEITDTEKLMNRLRALGYVK
jgi:arylsulfatase A-like enzyme